SETLLCSVPRKQTKYNNIRHNEVARDASSKSSGISSTTSSRASHGAGSANNISLDRRVAIPKTLCGGGGGIAGWRWTMLVQYLVPGQARLIFLCLAGNRIDMYMYTKVKAASFIPHTKAHMLPRDIERRL